MSIQKTNRYALKGFFANFLLALISHILDSNGVWYRHSWFWSEGSINTPNWTKDLDWQCHRLRWGPTSLWVKSLCSRVDILWRRKSRSFVVPRVQVPRDQILNQNFWVWGVYRPKPHPITFQNMRFKRWRKIVNNPFNWIIRFAHSQNCKFLPMELFSLLPPPLSGLSLILSPLNRYSLVSFPNSPANSGH